MKIIISHPTGNANVRAAVSGLFKAKLLDQFHTSIATFPGSFLNYISNISIFRDIKRREYDSNLKNFTRIYPWFEVGRLIACKAGFVRLLRHEKGIFSIDSVYRNMDKHISSILKKQGVIKKTEAVYAYEDGALQSFEIAKDLGIQCLYDLPIGYWRTGRRLLQNEQENWPEWASTITGFQDSNKKLLQKDQELKLADKIFVASKFTAETLREYPGKLASIKVIPYGFPPVYENRNYLKFGGRPIKILYVGSLSQRKGIANLFSAVNHFNKYVELLIIGRKTSLQCPSLDKELNKHSWFPSLPHDKVLQQMRQHDLLIFPSLFEGFGLVISEAMSQGTPVITTNRTAGPDLINHGTNGWIIEAGSTVAIERVIENILDRPESLSEVGFQAMKAAQKRPWEIYGKELAESILENLNSTNG